jgi:hypothetical protein
LHRGVEASTNLASPGLGQYNGSQFVKINPARRFLMKAVITLLCALAFGLSGIAFAGADSPSQAAPKVDCKKDPTNPACPKK